MIRPIYFAAGFAIGACIWLILAAAGGMTLGGL